VVALLVGCVPPPKAAFASGNLTQAPDAPSLQASPAFPAPPAGPAAIALDFDNADIEAVVQKVSEIVGFNYVLAPDVRGKVTVRTPRAIRPEDVFSVFLSILEVHGFTAVEAGDIYKIVRTERARERAIRTVVGPMPGQPSPPGPELPPRSGATPPTPPHSGKTPLGRTAAQAGAVGAQPMEVHVIPLHFADAHYLAGILNQVFAGAGLARPPAIIADPRTNSLVIRARRSDLEAIGRLLGRED
jgi:type II secretory pathway component GspD/PulD (secretin)